MSQPSPIQVETISEEDAWALHGIDAALIARATSTLWPHVSEPGERAEMSVLLTSDARIRELNAQFREKDVATNVLSFPSGDDEYIGDIALGLETVVREASELAVAVPDHVTHLVIHGTLHLLGYDHQDQDEAEEMEQLEVSILKGLGIADPYDGRDLSNAGAPQIASGDPV